MHNMAILRACICSILLMILMLKKQIHIIQLNSYNLDQQIIWYKKNLGSFLFNIILFIATFISYFFKKQFNNITLFSIGHIFIIICLFGILIENLPRKQKKKLVWTARIKRLVLICVCLLSIFFVQILTYKNKNDISYSMMNEFIELPRKFLFYGIALTPLIVFLSYLISLPIENAIRRRFMKEAHNIIVSNKNLFVIGITGSFGKTSVKYYLTQILNKKYNVCMTPESFNTSMGATITIKNNLKNYDEIFVCEMGARRVGDIKEICEIVEPTGAILTDVGNMHLDTFKNIENVCKCKFELIDATYKNICLFDKNAIANTIKTNIGYILVNGDNDLIMQKIMNEKTYNHCYTNQRNIEGENKKIWTYGLNENNDFYATDINANVKGINFKIVCYAKDENKKIVMNLEIKLLGKYNIKNLVAAVAYSMLLNVPLKEIVMSVKKIEPAEHRLQLITNDINNLIIDDAYNANPKGTRNAIDALSTFANYKKIVITPGMVELGDKQNYENEAFAEYASDKVDYAIIVGNTNKESLKKGFEKNLNGDNLLCIDKVEVAIAYARNNIDGKKVILLENDLSDNY